MKNAPRGHYLKPVSFVMPSAIYWLFATAAAATRQRVYVNNAEHSVELTNRTEIEIFCARVDLDDDDCHRLVSHSLDTPFDFLLQAASSRPNVPSGKDWLPSEYVAPEHLVRTLAFRVAAPWTKRGIGRTEVEAALALHADCMLVQMIRGEVMIGGDVEAWSKSTEWRSRRRRAVVDLVSELRFEKDVEFTFCPTDCIVTSTNDFYKHHDAIASSQPLPALTLVGCASSHNMPFPVFSVRSRDANESLANWDRIVEEIQAAPPPVSPSRRAIFRGRTKGQSCWPRNDPSREAGVASQTNDESGIPRCGRRRLHVLASRFPDQFDVGYDYIPLLEQYQRNRYQIYAEGHCGWADRLRFLLFSRSSALFFQETFCREYFALGLEPWVHYLPLDYLFDNLEEVHRWAENHPEAVEIIISNMNAYAAGVLSEAAVRSYAVSLLSQIADALRYRPEPRKFMLSVRQFREHHAI